MVMEVAAVGRAVVVVVVSAGVVKAVVGAPVDAVELTVLFWLVT